MAAKKLAVVGYGIAGAAIANALSESDGFEITVVSGRSLGSTYSNQRWKHSGLLYPSQDFARRMWMQHQSMHATLERPHVIKPRARFIALRQETIDALYDRWLKQWDVHGWGLDVRPLSAQEYGASGLPAETRAIGGFETPDCTMDFPAVVHRLRSIACRRGVTFVSHSDAVDVTIQAGRVVGIRLQSGERIACDACVLALGAWSGLFLRKVGLEVPIAVKRCVVVRFAGELVSCLTVCMDIRDGTHHSRDAALAPVHGETIGAEADGDEVDGPSDQPVDRNRIEGLLDDYETCFPRLRTWRFLGHAVCFKAEQRSVSEPELDLHVYDAAIRPGWPAGLFVAIPGKASFAFALASVVADRVRMSI
jgi:glycine/D-amino acid oxidase-like deaminating enzyme